jgi:hypothetical protein
MVDKHSIILTHNVMYPVARNPKFREKNMSLSSANRFMVVLCLADSSALKMEATCSTEMSVNFQQDTRRYIPE